ncbi:hypothetical protein [Mumia zhuanghuii]|uniref:Uncharacterized protein n=1 Tax=Mumia zhuanghuii TaxID=2585211 RepID=A0A5C4MC77_9ACTN|nr:hypothetical protein [Mumia zhuanghuii]TNC35429.1 hypothetical protein FHE65_27145 [Mumia zhuanghuii]
MKRSRLAIGIVVTGILGAVLTVPAQAEDAPAGGVFVPVTPTLLYGWGGLESGKVTPSSPKTIQVMGVAGVPSKGVSAVVVDVSAFSSTGVTNLYARTNASDPTVSMLTVGGDASATSNTAIVKPSAAGTISIVTNSQPAALTVDVQGYFTDTVPEGASGGFVAIEPTRLVGTNDGIGLPKAKLNAGTTYTTQIGGRADIPTDATAVSPTCGSRTRPATARCELVLRGRTSGAQPFSVNYETGRYSDSGMTIPLGTGAQAGKIALALTPGSADVIIDVQGYFTGAGDGTGGRFTSVPHKHFYDSRETMGGRLGPGEVRRVPVSGLAGIPDSPDRPVAAVVTTVVAFNWSAPGSVSVYNADLDTPNGTSTVGFRSTYTGAPEQFTAVVATSAYGEIAIRNNTAGTVDVVLAAQGWFGGESESAAIPEEGLVDPIGDAQEAEEPLFELDSGEVITDVTFTAATGAVQSLANIPDTTIFPSDGEFAAAAASGGGTWWDGVCTNGQSRYKHVREYTRTNVHSRMKGKKAIRYCGIRDHDGSEAAFGIRHVRDGDNGKHKSQFRKLASWEGKRGGIS